MKYSVGDKITIREDLNTATKYGVYCNKQMLKYAGKSYTISKTKQGSNKNCYSLEGIDFWVWSEDMFSIDSIPPLEDTIIECRNGNLYYMWSDIHAIRDGGFVEVNKDTRRIVGGGKDFEIIKVWEADHKRKPGNTQGITFCKGELLWERKDVKEMTISEIEKILGYGVKVIKDGKEDLEYASFSF